MLRSFVSSIGATASRSFATAAESAVTEALRALTAKKEELLNLHWDHEVPERVLKTVRELAERYANDGDSEVSSAAKKLLAGVDCAEIGENFVDYVYSLRQSLGDALSSSDGSTKDDARISPEMENEVSVAFNTYTELLNAVDGDRALERKVERDLGKQVLLLKQMLHIDNFRYHYAAVHPSGFSNSAD